jgi:GNAT superfamily N-acetyltransferase
VKRGLSISRVLNSASTTLDFRFAILDLEIRNRQSKIRNAYEMDYIEITDPSSDVVIQFHDALVESFPDPYGREDIPILRRNLQEGSWTGEDEVCRYHLIVARWNGKVVGGTSFYFFSKDEACLTPMGFGMGSYLAVKKELRGNGIGTKLIAMRDQTLSRDAREFNCYLRGLIIQVNDPELMNTEEIKRDSMDPWEREKFWKRRGYRKIVFNFIQPPIRGGEPPIEYLSLYMFPYCSQWKNMERISRANLWDIVYCFIRCTGTPGPSEADPSYLRMKSELAAQEHFQIL